MISLKKMWVLKGGFTVGGKNVKLKRKISKNFFFAKLVKLLSLSSSEKGEFQWHKIKVSDDGEKFL